MKGVTAEGYETFVRSETSGLLRLAFLLTGDAHEAEDLLQDAMLTMLRHWDRVRGAAKPAAYARRVLVNAHIDRHRRRSTDELPASTDTLTLLDRSSAFEQEQVDDRHWILSVIRTLPSRQRAVVVLRYYEGQTDAEIAELMGIRRVTVRSLAARALAALREHPTMGTAVTVADSRSVPRSTHDQGATA